MLGETQNDANKIQSLAKLIGNKNAFEQAFNQSCYVPEGGAGTAGQSMIGSPRDKVDEVLEASRRFMIGDREYEFNESESIFFIEKAIDPRSYHNTPDGCNTCGEKWKKATDLQGSHCHFCGKSTCKSCLTKTRLFKQNDQTVKLDKSGR